MSDLLEACEVSTLVNSPELRWIDRKALVIEPYRKCIFEQALYTVDANKNPRYNLALGGRAKKNFKTADEYLVALYRLLVWNSVFGNQLLDHRKTERTHRGHRGKILATWSNSVAVCRVTSIAACI